MRFEMDGCVGAVDVAISGAFVLVLSLMGWRDGGDGELELLWMSRLKLKLKLK